MITYTARWLFPVASPPLARGTITIDGERIVAVEPQGVRTPDVDLGNVAIIPGLVNAHTHLDLSGARGKIPPTDPEHFTDWLMGVIEYRRSRSPEQVQEDIQAGLAECLKYGTTLIGDITVAGASYPSLVASSLRAVIFWELIGLTDDRIRQSMKDFYERTGFEELSDRPPPWYPKSETDQPPPWYPETESCRWSLSPHSPYSVGHGDIHYLLSEFGGAIHLAESPAEMELLEKHSGPMVDFLTSLNVWKETAIFRNIRELFNIRSPTRRLYIHCNYLPTDVDFDSLQTVVFCPRTHAAFHHPMHAVRHFNARGVNVALGTDSLASNPDLDLFAEARFVYQNRKDVSGEQILKMATLNGAKALGFESECGSLEAGKSADFVVMRLADRECNDPYELLFACDAERRTLFQGEWRLSGN